MKTIWRPKALIYWPGLIFLLTGCGDDSSSVYVDVGYCDQLIAASPSSAGDESADPLENYQWYLDRVGIKELWRRGYTGREVHIAIVDDALEIAHEDLVGNVLPGRSRNYLEPPFSDMRFNPMPVDCRLDGHGTAVAGIIAAEGNNGIGIKGVAYGANIYLSNYLVSQFVTNLRDAMGRHTPDTAVSSNSWGSGATSRLNRQDSITRTIIASQLAEGFNGTGISYVFAAGNSRDISMERESVSVNSIDMASYSEMLNNPGIIVVCAVNVGNNVTSYSNPGANLWICGPSGDTVVIDIDSLDNDPNFLNYYHSGLPSVDLSSMAGYNRPAAKPAIDSEVMVRELGGHLDFGRGGFQLGFTLNDGNLEEKLPVISHQEPENVSPLEDGDHLSIYRQPGDSNYTRFFSGTSAATPVVSGVIALLRAEHRELTWRDIMLILAESAEQVNPDDASWQLGASAYHDPNKKYTHSIDYGFGLIDAAAAMELATNWRPLPASERADRRDRKEETLNRTRKEFEIEVPNIEIDFLEYVQLDINSNYPNFGHLAITLISPPPQRQESVLTRPHWCLDWDNNFASATATNDCPDLAGGFTFASTAYLGADPEGPWTLVVEGIELRPDLFRFFDLSWQLTFHGFDHPSR